MKSLFILALLLAMTNQVYCQNSKPAVAKAKVKTAKTTKVKSSFELLQGKWRSLDDKTNYLIFYNHYRKELSGRKVLDENKYSITDKCPDDNSTPVSNKNGKFLYQDGLCWSILKLNKKHLTLSLVGRGNTLKYIRIR